MQKSKQERQLDNSKEQLRVIKSELLTVNKELSEALLNKESVLNETERIKQQNNEVVKDISIRQLKIKQREKELDNKEKLLCSKEKEIKDNELLSIQKIDNEQKKLYKNTRKYEIQIIDLKDNIEKLKTKFNILSISVDVTEDLKNVIKKEIKKLSKNKSNLIKDSQKIEKEVRENIDKLNREINNKVKELSKLELQILEEQSKIGSAQKSIELEHKKLDNRKKQLDILIARFNRVWKEKYPHLELKV